MPTSCSTVPASVPQHCELHVSAHGVTLHVPPGTTVSVNGRAVDGLIALRPGDSVAFDRVLARLSAIETATPMRRGAGGFPTPANDDPGATAVRPVMPKFVLRGVSGAGLRPQLSGARPDGRRPRARMRAAARRTGLSRQHARLMPTERRRAGRGPGFDQRHASSTASACSAASPGPATRSASTRCASA